MKAKWNPGPDSDSGEFLVHLRGIKTLAPLPLFASIQINVCDVARISYVWASPLTEQNLFPRTSDGEKDSE